MRSWWRLGGGLILASVAAGTAMQAVTGEWFPPPVSVSQYGVGPWGWLFSLFLVTQSLAPFCLQRALGTVNRTARVLLVVGFVGALVTAIVRTQAGGAQVSWNAKVHMVSSIVALAFLPLGVLAVMWPLGRRRQWTGGLFLGVIGASMALLLFAAAGYDTAGLGPHESWAFWQAFAIVVCWLMIGSAWLAVGRNVGHSMRHHTPSVDRYRAAAS